MNELKDHINHKLYEECSEFIKNVRECRQKTTLTRYLSQFDWLCHQTRVGCSNHSDGHSKNTYTCTLAPATATVTTPTTMYLEKWVKNLLGIPLTKAQVSLLAYGPNFTVAPRHPPTGNTLMLWSKPARTWSHMMQKSLEQKYERSSYTHIPRKIITKEEDLALTELRKDQSRVILAADKGVAQ